MKAMILVLSPKENCDLLNGDLSVLPRKRFPIDYVGWVYTYCMEGKLYLFKDLYAEKGGEGKLYYVDNKEHDSWSQKLNGRVVARFWCDKVEELYPSWLNWHYKEGNFCNMSIPFDYRKKDFWEELAKKSCLSIGELFNYLNLEKNEGYAIHVTKVEPLDEPKEIGDFYKAGYYKAAEEVYRDNLDDGYDKSRAWAKAERSVHNDFALTCVPRSGWRYIDV